MDFSEWTTILESYPLLIPVFLLLVGGAFWLQRIRIETLKDDKERLKEELREAENYLPDILLERFRDRLKASSEELAILYSDEKKNRQKIVELEADRDKTAEDRNRYKLASEELAVLYSDEKKNRQKIAKLEAERDKTTEDMERIINSVLKTVDSLEGFDCVFCYDKKEHDIKLPFEFAGKNLTVDINAMCNKCGRRKIEAKVNETA